MLPVWLQQKFDNVVWQIHQGVEVVVEGGDDECRMCDEEISSEGDKNTELNIYPTFCSGTVCMCLCIYMWKYISVHICLSKCFQKARCLLLHCPGAIHCHHHHRRRCCSPVRQVLPTGSVNINKNLLPLCQLLPRLGWQPCKCRALHKQPVRPGPASPADRWAQRGQVWLQAVCTSWMIKLRERTGNIAWHCWWKKCDQSSVWNIKPSLRMRFVMKKCC